MLIAAQGSGPKRAKLAAKVAAKELGAAATEPVKRSSAGR